MKTTTNEMRIYIADLAAYNNGLMSGAWVDLPCDDMDAALAAILEAGTAARVADGCYDGVPSEEWAIHDHEGLEWYGSVSEYENLGDLNIATTTYDELEDYDKKKLDYLMSQCGYALKGALSALDNCSIYEDMTMLDLAYEFVDDGSIGEVPAYLINYIDYEAFARDLSMDYVEYNGDIYRAG